MDTHDAGAASPPESRQDSGAVVAALMAAGVGCAALGLCVVLARASLSFQTLMDLYAPAGPLTGKTTVAPPRTWARGSCCIGACVTATWTWPGGCG